MGFFDRRKKDESITVIDSPEIIERPTVSIGELERMVYETYQEKLELEKRLESANKEIETLRESRDKLRAAETFSRQSESERSRLNRSIDDLKIENGNLSRELKEKKSKNLTLELKISDLENEDLSRKAAYRREFADTVKEAVREMRGNLSKDKITKLLDELVACEEEAAGENSENDISCGDM